MKQIIPCKRVLECKEGFFDNAKDALRFSNMYGYNFFVRDSDFFRPSKYENSLPNVFKAAIRVKFTRKDCKVITRKVLITTEYYASYTSIDIWCQKCYHHSIIRFR